MQQCAAYVVAPVSAHLFTVERAFQDCLRQLLSLCRLTLTDFEQSQVNPHPEGHIMGIYVIGQAQIELIALFGIGVERYVLII